MVFSSSSSNLSPLAPPFTVERAAVSRSPTIPLADLSDSFYLPVDRSSPNAYLPLNSSITIRHPDSDPLLPSSLDYTLFSPPSLNLTDPSRRYNPPRVLPSSAAHPNLGFHENEKGEFNIKTDTKEISYNEDSVLFFPEDGKLHAVECEVLVDSLCDRDDENMNLVEDSPCWIPRFPSHTKQSNGAPLRFNQELDSSDGQPSPIPLSYDASTSTSKAKTLVTKLLNLSDSLTSQCSELREEDCDAINLVIEKLSSCVQKKPERPAFSQSPSLLEKMFGEMKQKEEAAQAIKKIVAESFRLEGEESPQARLYKNLWLEAEASQFYLTYMNRFNRTKMELEKYENEASIGRDFVAPKEMEAGGTNQSTMVGDNAVRLSDIGAPMSGRCTGVENYGGKEEEAEVSVMARLQILKRRERMFV